MMSWKWWSCPQEPGSHRTGTLPTPVLPHNCPTDFCILSTDLWTAGDGDKTWQSCVHHWVWHECEWLFMVSVSSGQNLWEYHSVPGNVWVKMRKMLSEQHEETIHLVIHPRKLGWQSLLMALRWLNLWSAQICQGINILKRQGSFLSLLNRNKPLMYTTSSLLSKKKSDGGQMDLLGDEIIMN